jgi:hypothetical protein
MSGAADSEEAGLVVTDLCLRAVYNIDAGDDGDHVVRVWQPAPLVKWSRWSGRYATDPRARLLELDLVEDLPLVLSTILDMRAGDPPLFLHVGYDSHDRIQMRFAEY